MIRLIDKPYLIFWFSIPLILLFGFIGGDDTLVINVLDTYYVISQLHIATLISIIFGIIGLGYWIMFKTKRRLLKWLNLIHIVLTFGGILLILIAGQLYRDSVMDYDFNSNLTIAIYIIVLIILLGQILYLINIIGGMTRKRKDIAR